MQVHSLVMVIKCDNKIFIIKKSIKTLIKKFIKCQTRY